MRAERKPGLRRPLAATGHPLIRLANYALATAVAFGCLGCIGGGSPHNVMLTIANASGDAAMVSWSRPGLLGTPLFPDTGTDRIEACNQYLNGFGAGHNEVSISAGDQTLSLVFNPSSTDQINRYVLIASDGSITEVDQASMPTSGCGMIS
jgi:hypothetical protein